MGPITQPPMRRRIARRNLGRPQRDQMAPLVRIAAYLRAILAPHVALQLVNRRRLRPPHDVERDGLVRVAAKALHLEIRVPGVERVTERGRWLRRSLEGQHSLLPRLAGQPVGLLARLSRALGRHSD
jgi:hypothetical protein